MKTIATIIASLLLSLGLFASPASAEEPEPVDCDETIQAWRGRALIAENRATYLDAQLYFATVNQRALEDRVTTLLARVDFIQGTLDEARETVTRQNRRLYRNFNRIGRQQAVIDRLRAKLERARN